MLTNVRGFFLQFTPHVNKNHSVLADYIAEESAVDDECAAAAAVDGGVLGRGGGAALPNMEGPSSHLATLDEADDEGATDDDDDMATFVSSSRDDYTSIGAPSVAGGDGDDDDARSILSSATGLQLRQGARLPSNAAARRRARAARASTNMAFTRFRAILRELDKLLSVQHLLLPQIKVCACAHVVAWMNSCMV